MARIIAFAGPSLYSLGARRRELFEGIDLRPPARRGDIIAAMSENPETMLLLDGYFFGELSVAHKELLYALQTGIRVIGAASMGALRAAEMSALGMVGVGQIYEWFASGALDGDDEVALLHLTEEQHYRPLSVALVEVRRAGQQLVKNGVCSAAENEALIGSLKRLAFWERTPGRIQRLAGEHLGEAAVALEGELEHARLKGRDVRLAVEAARAGGPSLVPSPPTRSTFLTYWCEDHFRVPASVTRLPACASLLQAWNMAQLFHDQAPCYVAQLRLRFLAASAAARARITAEPAKLRGIADRLAGANEQRWGGQLLPSAELAEEARVQALSDAACEAFGGAEAAADWLATRFGLDADGGHRRLLHLLSVQFGLQSAWHLARSFAFAGCLDRALELACAANEIYDCFELWSQGSRISVEELVEVAAELWEIDSGQVQREANSRGLQEAQGFSQGLREVLQRVAAAERLPRPINDYCQRKAALRAADLDYPVELLPGQPGPRPARIVPPSRPERVQILTAVRGSRSPV